jgi:hypothetical protein
VSNNKDVKRETVEKVAERLKQHSNMDSEKAHRIAREGAEKINRERREKK